MSDRAWTAIMPSSNALDIDQVLGEIDSRLLLNPAARLLNSRTAYGRVAGLALLSHQHLYHGELKAKAIAAGDPQVSSLLVRHLLEAWATGIALTRSVANVDRFFGSARSYHKKTMASFNNLFERLGMETRFELDPDAFRDFPTSQFSFEKIFNEAAAVLESRGARDVDIKLYETTYRSLSNNLAP